MARKLIFININNFRITRFLMNIDFPNSEPVFPISTAAKLLNISVHTLRMYEKEGLIIPKKTEGNQRAYSQKDLERVACIRKAINEHKISINGIKTIYSLIPCWNIIGCSSEDRVNCQAYIGHSQPCWSYKHPNTTCEHRDCNQCSVYKETFNCGQVKDLIKNITKD